MQHVYDPQNNHRKQEYFHHDLYLYNFSGPVNTQITIEEKDGSSTMTSETGWHFLAQNPEGFTYDGEGNLLSDGRWTYTWDAENRLVQIVEKDRNQSYPEVYEAPLRKLVFIYDDQGRRVLSEEAFWDPWLSSWESLGVRHYAYSGWNVIAEGDAPASGSWTIDKTCLWGLDLGEQDDWRLTNGWSGIGRSAGGVGGLLLVSDHSAHENHFVHHDANGNVVALVDADGSGELSAIYDYDAFGQLIRATGPAAELNPFRFSTKYHHDYFGLYYYGYRYYRPSMGRFLNRDPIEEQGGLNLYAFVGNDPVNRWDYLGLSEQSRNCSWKIYVAHGTDNWRRFKDRKDPQCGDRSGFVGCGMNNLNPRLPVGDLIPIPINPPGLPSIPSGPGGAPIRDPNEDPNYYEPLDPNHPARPGDWDGVIDIYHFGQLDSLMQEAWRSGIEAARKECGDGASCCRSVVLSVHCGRGVSHEMCGRSETINCR